MHPLKTLSVWGAVVIIGTIGTVTVGYTGGWFKLRACNAHEESIRLGREQTTPAATTTLEEINRIETAQAMDV